MRERREREFLLKRTPAWRDGSYSRASRNGTRMHRHTGKNVYMLSHTIYPHRENAFGYCMSTYTLYLGLGLATVYAIV